MTALSSLILISPAMQDNAAAATTFYKPSIRIVGPLVKLRINTRRLVTKAAKKPTGNGVAEAGPQPEPPRSVDKIVGRIEVQLNKCRIKKIRRSRDPSNPDRFDCVADALEQAANELSKQPELKKAETIIRQAATNVRKAKTVKQATAALSTAKKQLLRSSGLILIEHQKLALLTDTAKSVLRS